MMLRKAKLQTGANLPADVPTRILYFDFYPHVRNNIKSEKLSISTSF